MSFLRSIPPRLAALILVALLVAYSWFFLRAEEEWVVAVLLVIAALFVVVAARFGFLAVMGRTFGDHEALLDWALLLGLLVIAWLFREDHFTLLMVTTTMIFMTACLGLNIQLGYAGILNFAGGSFLGVGCYTAAVLTLHTSIPPILILVIGGVMAALIGSLLILPVLRTRGHYSAVVTIAFALLFKTFLEVNPRLGGPQGLPVGEMSLLGWGFNSNIEIGDFFASFYLNYYLLALVMLVLAVVLTRRIERSWIGLNMDAVRLDETAAACYGINVARWKIKAFVMGNFLCGLAGALFGMILAYIAPANFGFGESLILLSIVLLGGMGSIWGVAVAAAIIVILPEKLQLIEEYRFLLFAALVILVLRFRPNGLIPRPLRRFMPAWRPD